MTRTIKNIPVLNRREDSNEEETQIRLTLSFEHAYSYEHDTVLGETYRLWRSACEAPHNIPPTTFLENLSALTADPRMTNFLVIDVSSDDPLNFFVKEHTAKTPFGSNEGLRLFEFPSQILRDALLVEYALAKSNERLTICEVHHWRIPREEGLKNISRHYVKIDLPLIDPTSGKVQYLLGVARLIEENVVGLPRLLKNSELVG